VPALTGAVDYATAHPCYPAAMLPVVAQQGSSAHEFMTTVERQNIRKALLDAGFRRESYDEPRSYDLANSGIYTEYWRHSKDRTQVVLNWDRKTR
jgi:hypothetical protein